MAKWLAERVLPIDQVDGDRLFAEAGTDSRTIAKQTVDVAVGVVERSAPAESGGLVQFLQRFGDDGGVVTLAREESPEMVGFDVPVVLAFVPVAEEGVAEVVLEVVNDPALSASLDLADGSHRALPEPGSGEGSRSVVDSPSTFQYPPLSGPTRSIFPAARNLSSRYRTVDVVVPRVAAISRRLTDGCRRRSARIRS